MPQGHHRWKFIRSGGIDQVVIRNGADIVNLEHLDQKLWVALACPTRGLAFDSRTLDLIDSDGDGRIRPPELIAVSRWVAEHFVDPDLLVAGGDGLPLSAIRVESEDGQLLAAEAKALLAVAGRPDADALTLADLATRQEVLAERGLNGDGVVPLSAADDPATALLIQTIIDTVGGVADSNGKLGVDAAHAELFFAQATALHAWRGRLQTEPLLTPLGADSLVACEALHAVRAKVDDYFVRCRLAAFDEGAAAALNPSADDYLALHTSVLDTQTTGIAQMPLATAAPGRALPLQTGLNPAWAARVAALQLKVAQPLLARTLDRLTEEDWERLKVQMGPCSSWLVERPPTALDGVSADALAGLLAEGRQATLSALIALDTDAGPSNPRVLALEKMLRFKRDLVHLLNNYVSFSEFYSRQGAIFEAGVLYLDARSCQLAIEVDDVGKHVKLAGLAKTYLAYCDCRRELQGQPQKKTIVAAFTAGDVDFLFAGRNGIFYDRQGNDWDATISKVIENPLSVRQAFFSPYKKFLRLIEEQVAKRAAASDQKSQGFLGNLAQRTTTADKTPPAVDSAKDGTSRIDVGTVAALGVALGSISAVLVGVFASFVDLGWWIPAGLLGIVLAISGPSMLIAWLKLRQRSLGPILDASGWAINGRMRINVPLGASLTRKAALPAGADRRMKDPYAPKQTGRWLWLLVFVLAAVALYVGRFQDAAWLTGVRT